MPIRRTGIKQLRVIRRKKLRNLQVKTDLKKTIKKFKELVKQQKVEQAHSALKILYKKIDKAVKRNILQKNTAARRKSSFSKLIENKA